MSGDGEIEVIQTFGDVDVIPTADGWDVVLEGMGVAGPAGEDAAGAIDPGDLTLMFDNQLL